MQTIISGVTGLFWFVGELNGSLLPKSISVEFLSKSVTQCVGCYLQQLTSKWLEYSFGLGVGESPVAIKTPGISHSSPETFCLFLILACGLHFSGITTMTETGLCQEAQADVILVIFQNKTPCRLQSSNYLLFLRGLVQVCDPDHCSKRKPVLIIIIKSQNATTERICRTFADDFFGFFCHHIHSLAQYQHYKTLCWCLDTQNLV